MIAFGAYEILLAPYPIITAAFMKNKAVVGAAFIGFFDFVSETSKLSAPLNPSDSTPILRSTHAESLLHRLAPDILLLDFLVH